MNGEIKKKEADFIFVIPKKARPAQAFNEVAARAGFKIVQPDQHIPDVKVVDATGDLPDIEARALRCSDALQRIRYGFASVAIVGRDTLEEYNAELRAQGRPDVARVVAALPDVAACALKVLVRNDDPASKPQDLEGKRIATSYPAKTAAWLKKQGVQRFEIISAEGNVESFVKDRIADVGVDIVESGYSARVHGLRVTDMTVLQSSSLIVRAAESLTPEKETIVECLVGRLVRGAEALAARPQYLKDLHPCP